MGEIEVPLEQTQEHMLHAIHESHGHSGSDANWITWGALASAIFAVLAAIAALKAGHLADEGMLEQIRASNQWGYYQAKSIKSNLIQSRIEFLTAIGKPVDEKLTERIAEYEKQQKEIQEKATELQASSEHEFSVHTVFSQAVTMFQIAIAIAAIAVLSKKRQFLFVSLIFGCIGTFFVVHGFILV